MSADLYSDIVRFSKGLCGHAFLLKGLSVTSQRTLAFLLVWSSIHGIEFPAAFVDNGSDDVLQEMVSQRLAALGCDF